MAWPNKRPKLFGERCEFCGGWQRLFMGSGFPVLQTACPLVKCQLGLLMGPSRKN